MKVIFLTKMIPTSHVKLTKILLYVHETLELFQVLLENVIQFRNGFTK